MLMQYNEKFLHGIFFLILLTDSFPARMAEISSKFIAGNRDNIHRSKPPVLFGVQDNRHGLHSLLQTKYSKFKTGNC